MPHRFGLFRRRESSESMSSDPCVKEFKECVNEVKNEYPDAAAGAVNQLAMQRFAGRCRQNRQSDASKKDSASLLRNNCFTKFLIRKPSRDNDKSDHLKVDAQLEKQRSLPLRKNKSVDNDLGQIESLHEPLHPNLQDRRDSLLEHSLSTIELEASLDRWFNQRLSEVLAESSSRESSIVLEGEEDESEYSLSVNSSNKLLQKDDATPMQLQDAKDTLKNSQHSKDNKCTIPIATPMHCRKRSSFQSRKYGSSIPRLSLTDSLTSFDEMNFGGDFSAWSRRRSSRTSFKSSVLSLRRDSVLSLSSTDSFNPSMGDFTAWNNRKRSLRGN